MDKLFVVMPAYNEEANIRSVVRQWYPVLGADGVDPQSRLVVADSGSTDRTHDILLELQRELPQLQLLTDTGTLHGPKVIALYDCAIRSGADYIFQTDSDGQTDPGEFAAFWAERERFDGIFGYRNARGDGFSRAVVEWAVCLLLRIYFGVKVPDANAPFRLMRAETVGKYLPRLPRDYNLPNIMLTTYFTYYGERVHFPTVSFKPRQGGTNSINIPKIVKIGLAALKDFARFRREL